VGHRENVQLERFALQILHHFLCLTVHKSPTFLVKKAYIHLVLDTCSESAARVEAPNLESCDLLGSAVAYTLSADDGCGVIMLNSLFWWMGMS